MPELETMGIVTRNAIWRLEEDTESKQIYDRLFGEVDPQVVLQTFTRLISVRLELMDLTIYCNENHLEWHQDSTNPDGGMWFDTIAKESFSMSFKPQKRGRRRQTLCRDDEDTRKIGTYVYLDRFLVICPQMFDLTGSREPLQSLLRKSNLEPRSIDDVQPLSVSLLFEFAEGDIAVRNANVSAPNWLSPQRLYDFKDSVDIARFGLAGGENPNAYATLGKALYLDRWNWATGFADGTWEGFPTSQYSSATNVHGGASRPDSPKSPVEPDTESQGSNSFPNWMAVPLHNGG
ncbi:MAG: hypothetical protein M1825_004757 [Sarcosagium campestre]|nr:MAG: hypothetical protein M1825_004757 [Sarcosagium campestre]